MIDHPSEHIAHWCRNILVILIHRSSQQTRDTEPMLVYCWASVVDGGTTLNQHWLNGSCLLGSHNYYLH